MFPMWNSNSTFQENSIAGISALTDVGIPAPPPPPPTPPPPAQGKVEARKRPKGLTILAIFWSLGSVYNFYASLYIIRIDLGALPRLSNPSAPEWYKFGVPAELLIGIIGFAFGLIQMITIYGWWTGKSWSYKTALFLLSFAPISWIYSALLYASAPVEYGFVKSIYLYWLGFGGSIILFIIYYWYLRKPHVKEYLGVGVESMAPK